jgi:hypothetical protein
MQITEDQLTFYYNRNLKKVPSYHLLKSAVSKRGAFLVDFYNEFLIDIYVLLDNLTSKYIAIDWDNTVSADRTFFLNLINILQEKGYTPFICTLRAPDRENIIEISAILDAQNISIYLTDGRSKRDYMKSMGIDVHLWIDDFYPSICREVCPLLTKNGIE